MATNSIVVVTVNGPPVDALDAAGNFFSAVQVRPGQNSFEVVATDTFDQRTTNTITVYGSTCPETFSSLGVVSASVQPEYGHTSFNEWTKTLYADLALRNVGAYPVRSPFYVGVTRISDPTAQLLAPDGITADGIPYYDFSGTITNILNPQRSSLTRALAFHNPSRAQFTYDLVVLGQLNQAPYFSTAPPLEAIVGKSYTYDFNALDPDGDPLTYALLSSPSGMVLNAQSSTLNFQPSTNQLGTHDITIQASDGKGGLAEQHYLLNVIAPPSNRPPYFVSRPVTVGSVCAAEGGLRDLIKNGSFEEAAPWGYHLYAGSTAISNWTVIGYDVHYTRNVFWAASDGVASVDLDGFSNGGLEQTFETVPGEEYLLQFHLAGNAYSGPRAKTMIVEAANHRTNFSYDIADQNASTWNLRWDIPEWHFVAVSNHTSLQMYSTTSPAGWGPVVDEVHVYEARQGDAFWCYTYDADALDPDGDTLTYALVVSPTNMTINPTTGFIRWGPRTNDVGTHNVTVQVHHGRGGTNLQSYTIYVLPGDQPPVITRQPVDLTIGQVDASGVTADGQTLLATGTVSARITNRGPGATPVPFDVLFFEDRNLNGAFEETNDIVLGTATVTESLPPAGSLVITAAVSGPVIFPGNVIWAFVDSQNAIAETDEGNNLANSGLACIAQPQIGQFNPIIKWHKTNFAVMPDSKQIMMTPAVADLDADGVPDIVFTTYESTDGANSYGGILRAVRGDNGADLWNVTNAAYKAYAFGHVAVGDINQDGKPDIVAVQKSGSWLDNRLMAFEHDGTYKWSSPAVWGGVSGGAPSLADLDGDGIPEIVIGASVLNSNGTIRWEGSGVGGQGTGKNQYTPISLVADLDLDGHLEVIAGKSAYRADGSLYWNSSAPDGFTAIGNFDDDPYPEVVLVSGGNVYVLEHTGAVKWGPVAIPGGGRGGPPTIADVDGDGLPEIGVAGADRYVVFNHDGTLLWQVVTQDHSSNYTGSSIFDFEGDGRAEVVYGDELFLRIYRGTDGTSLYQLPKSSCTATEYPVIADVDADGNAEIVAVANVSCGFGPQFGLYVIGDANDTWANTRKIWNQHTYHINNVSDDGTIPRYETNSWQTHNTYRLNALPNRGEALAAPDLVAAYVRAIEDSGAVTLTARIGNGGAVLAPQNTKVAFYASDPRVSRVLLGVASTAARIVPGAFEDVSLVLTNPAATDLWIVADDDGTGRGQVNECQEGNNYYHAGFALPLANHPPLITSAPVLEATEGQSYQYDVEATDADAGDTLIFSLAVAPDVLTEWSSRPLRARSLGLQARRRLATTWSR